jgi:Flp pilus assembly protein TadG
MRPPQGQVRDERGVMALEFLLVISMLIVVFLLMLQYAVRAHAQRIATAAAQEGLATASSYDGTASDGERTATQYLTSIGPGLASSHVSATRSATTATVTVTGEVDQLIPFLGVTVRVHVEGPVERFVTALGQAPP